MLTASPATSATISRGPAIFSARLMAWEARLTTVSWFMRGLLVKTLDECSDDQIPAVDQHEQEDLERQRDEGRRQHDHPHAHQRRGDDQVDDQERQEDQEADLKRDVELGDDEGRDQHLGRDFGAGVWRLCFGEIDEQLDVLWACLAEHE